MALEMHLILWHVTSSLRIKTYYSHLFYVDQNLNGENSGKVIQISALK